MTDDAKRLVGYCIAVVLAAFTLALTIAVFLDVAPGLLPVFLFAVLCWAKDLTWDSEFARILEGV